MTPIGLIELSEHLNKLLAGLNVDYIEIVRSGSHGWSIRDHTDEGLSGKGYDSGLKPSFASAYTVFKDRMTCKHEKKKVLDVMDRRQCGKTYFYRCLDCGHDWHVNVKADSSAPKCKHKYKLMGEYEDETRGHAKWSQCTLCGHEHMAYENKKKGH